MARSNVLCSLHDGRDYSDLLPHTIELTDGAVRLRILDLDTLRPASEKHLMAISRGHHLTKVAPGDFRGGRLDTLPS